MRGRKGARRVTRSRGTITLDRRGTEAPRISVVIPAYNAANTIGAQLIALAAQDLAEIFDVVVSDNGSTDDTQEVVIQAAMANDLSLLLCRAAERRGPGHARNVGAAHARGEVLLFCDADDIAEPTWAHQLMDSVLLTGAAAGRLAKFVNDDPSQVDATAPALQRWHDVEQLAWPVTACFGVTREVFESLDGFDETVPSSEDLDFGIRLGLSGRSITQSEAQVRYRTRANPQKRRAQLRTYARWESFMQARYRALLRRHGVAALTPLTAARAVLGHVRRRPDVVAEHGEWAWNTWFLTRWSALAGQIHGLVPHRSVGAE